MSLAAEDKRHEVKLLDRGTTCKRCKFTCLNKTGNEAHLLHLASKLNWLFPAYIYLFDLNVTLWCPQKIRLLSDHVFPN